MGYRRDHLRAKQLTEKSTGPDLSIRARFAEGPSHPSAVVHQRDGILSAPGHVATAVAVARSTRKGRKDSERQSASWRCKEVALHTTSANSDRAVPRPARRTIDNRNRCHSPCCALDSRLHDPAWTFLSLIACDRRLADHVVEAVGIELVGAQREKPTLSRTCNDHAALRMSRVSVRPGSSSLYSIRVAAVRQRTVQGQPLASGLSRHSA